MTHVPVLLQEVVDGLSLKKDDVFFDGTLGAGGHSIAVAKSVGNNLSIIGTDLDHDAVLRAEKVFTDAGIEHQLFVANFREIETVLEESNVETIDGALLDLGISSFQLDEVPRGFSFKRNEPLLMTLKKDISEDDITAADIVNLWSEETLTDIIRAYGEERYAQRIARAIVTARSSERIETTGQLVDVIINAVPAVYRRGRIHPATRTFQAIRIAVNEELQSLTDGLEKIFSRLSPGGRLAVISFHSLEDRIVKRFMVEKKTIGVGLAITKKPIIPSEEESKENPRSRSSKLRIIQKI